MKVTVIKKIEVEVGPNADLRNADLRNANLGGADLGGADLRDANLSGANLGGADLSNVVTNQPDKLLTALGIEVARVS